MSELVKATPGMFEEVLPVLGLFQNPPREREQWRRLFAPPWDTGEDHCGYVLRDAGKVVGFIGMVYSRRQVAGREERFCNLTSFVTDPEHRHEGLSLLMPVLRLADCTVTNFTPSEAVYPLFKRLGFEVLDETMHILLPLPDWRLLGRDLAAAGRIHRDPAKIRPLLTTAEQAIFDAHQLPGVWHLLIREADEQCYVVFNRTKGRKRTFSCVHYLGNPEVFFGNLNRVKWHMARLSGTPFIMVMGRHAGGRRLGSCRTVSVRYPALFKSASVKPAQIDGLYSELLLLNL